MQKTSLILLLLFLTGSLITQNADAQTVAYRDVIINEFLADPTPVVGLPEREFVEIFNRSNKTIDMTNWTIKDASTSRGTFPSVSLLPGEYAIVCRSADAALFAPFGKVIAASTLPALNNDQDSIIIRTADGFTVDAIYYTDAWYRNTVKKDGGYTIELINPNLDCSTENNWIASNDVSGGTPGRANSVLDLTPDNTAPVLTGFVIQTSSAIVLNFSEGIDTVTGKNPNLYVFEPALTVSEVIFSPDAKSATLLLATPLVNGVIYSLEIIGISDCEGNSIAPVTINLGQGKMPEFGDLLITEIMADPTPVVQLPEEEYFEIYNASGEAVDLNGLIVSTGTRTSTFSSGLLLPGEYAVVVSSTAVPAFAFAPKVIALSSFPTLTNSGSDVSLVNSDNVQIFHVAYSDTWYNSSLKREGGWSLEMIDVGNPCAGKENWTASVNSKGGTPGELNSVNSTLADDKAPTAVAVDIIDSVTIRLVFNEKVNPTSVFINNLNITPSIGITSVTLNQPAATSVNIVMSNPILSGVTYTLTAKDFSDCLGNLMTSKDLIFGLPQLPEAGDIIINELMFDPLTNGQDFVELWNVGDKILTLADMAIAREDRLTDEVITYTSMLNVPRLILPGQYMVISANGETVRSQYQTPGEGVFADIPGFPGYVTEGGKVALYRKDQTILDRFPYDDDLHFRLLDVTKGVSLERISPDKSTDDRNNWNSAALQVGGATPGYQNSNFLIPQIKGDLTVSPEVFSPDQDGIDDLLSIAYSLEKPGYLGTVNVYTIEGIPVRKLLQNETLAQQGFFTWNGLDDDDRRARVGIYVVVLEVFDLDGNKDVLRAKCVLASRLR